MTNDLIALFVDVDKRLAFLKTTVRMQKTAEDKAETQRLAKALKIQVANLVAEIEKS